MNARILVTYASRAGSTTEIAHLIGEGLGARGFAVDVRSIKSRPPVESYQAVFIGSAVRSGRWLPEAVSFVAENQLTLKRVPVAVFTVHLHNRGADLQSITNRRAYLSQLRPLLRPAAEAYFAGALVPANLSWLERLVARAAHAPVGDFRDRDVVRAWAQHVMPWQQPEAALST